MTCIAKSNHAMNTLGEIYAMFDTAMAAFPFACAKQCADCCTCNVTATGLEIAYIHDRLDGFARDDIRVRLDRAGQTRRYRPFQTTNGFALACMAGRDADEEENDPSWGICPLLDNGICTIYPVRPLGCRVMMSTTPCRQTGQADMPFLALTITTVFMQFVEHLDAGGVYGNFLDLLEHAGTDALDCNGVPGRDKIPGTVKNLKIPALMIPPGHVGKTRNLVQSLGALIRKNDRPLT
ncbi:YkgJ family cysteine cluster protein [Desulfobacter vibrioformis]|uniref:YkgJ family cysteine cluster protein n=1 Tax=Desulfobacter vibrioformis TaxID=34031 RepID=UPI00054E384B|nr:YkgJ family cysteine cluster protein [Desulfobacter vibrioformis]